MNAVLPFALFAAFLAYFWVRARRDGMPVREWLERRNRATFTQPGWWRPAAVWAAFLMIVFVVVTTAKHGWRWQYLLVFPLLGGFFAASLALLAWVARRR